jgi:hypothetical protein
MYKNLLSKNLGGPSVFLLNLTSQTSKCAKKRHKSFTQHNFNIPCSVFNIRYSL